MQFVKIFYLMTNLTIENHPVYLVKVFIRLHGRNNVDRSLWLMSCLARGDCREAGLWSNSENDGLTKPERDERFVLKIVNITEPICVIFQRGNITTFRLYGTAKYLCVLLNFSWAITLPCFTTTVLPVSRTNCKIIRSSYYRLRTYVGKGEMELNGPSHFESILLYTKVTTKVLAECNSAQ